MLPRILNAGRLLVMEFVVQYFYLSKGLEYFFHHWTYFNQIT